VVVLVGWWRVLMVEERKGKTKREALNAEKRNQKIGKQHGLIHSRRCVCELGILAGMYFEVEEIEINVWGTGK
jgi:hypothetical protein